jgi:amino acid transporter
MESGSLTESGGITVEKPQLKSNAITFLSNIVIGVASTAPGYSLAATLGFIAAVVGLGYQSPAVMIVAFVPMICIASAYNYMNRADPDCGTTFAWVTKAMGPWMGWQGGWAIVVADVLVMPSLAQVAGIYTFSLFGTPNPSNFDVALVGIAWIIIMTAICYIGIELSARTQQVLLGMELFILALFSVVALIDVYTGHPAHSVHPAFSWFDPLSIHSVSAFNNGILLAIFVYWGWDSGVSVNEETEDASSAPGRAAVISTVVLVLVYVFVTAATQAYGGLQSLIAHPDDVFAPLSKSVLGSPLDKLLIIAVLSSASASTQTTILPTARTTLSMARAGSIPKQFGNIHPRHLSPGFSTIWMGVVSAIVYILLTATSNNLIGDAFTSLALTIAFYYGFTGYACVVYYRKHIFKSVRNFVMMGVVPLFGALFLTFVLVYAVITYSKPHSGYAKPFLGIGSPIAIALLTVVLGFVGMFIQRLWMPDFFKLKPEVVDPAIVAGLRTGTASFAAEDDL